MTDASYPVRPETTPTRHRERVSYDRAAVHAVLDEALLCHVGFVMDGLPVVLPQLHARVGERLYLHGSSGARALRAAGDAGDGGIPICVTVTLVDGLVLARSAFNHSINSRSVVVHGVARRVTDEAEKRSALTCLVDAVVPGRSDHVRGPSGRELAATTVLALELENVSLKVRSGDPMDEEEDLTLPFWAGVLPLTAGAAPPETAANVAEGIDVPEHVRRWARPAR
ncbi:pyridoxamine 5'-phosphate oxidase family protein [Jatrophihabitans telluris]|uniref:Pyridoxamine 5'-phosphate oxidase family protein n=1 Tax=Jatrophihabitans telluris TaxID=2038343 RepID=A0ABY4QWN6_9ACTN|nr:pyridoxamine 5'-phosphate oxidase family protein [Jatrophihabitans telluris]UQX87369.1 pyridoxamine 5'-phosphate oxidase family protein [Jatrophihabitans telluris]